MTTITHFTVEEAVPPQKFVSGELWARGTKVAIEPAT